MMYNYGDPVKVKVNAPERFSPGIKGSLCGVRTIETEAQAKSENVNIGTVLWILEVADGSSIEVPEGFLIPLE